MNTLFQISITSGWSLFTKFFPSTVFLSCSALVSTCISVHGPQGPVSPISQKLSFLFPMMILSSISASVKPESDRHFFQKPIASSSLGRPSFSSPSKTVTYNLSLSILYTSVSSSQLQAMASSLK